ncbi:MAG: bifunctional DNA-formamidopyrimidine glycosylase/DNA-(apurinic or apyrimidinic site) lyase [Candidatus Magasanikbacteria bacterium]|nr:bifunctional DNA-formamidopyrimidine glycosylase/DNA-(apurinic or apyrimidinic site) lyase [Candidatus Magasanikbacteria bacterium]
MPELPEVETIRRGLVKKILNKKIVHVQVYHHTSVGNVKTKFVQALTGNSIAAIERRGKLMVFQLKKGTKSVLAHLKMTGQLIYEREIKKRVELVAGGHKLSESDIENLPNKHTRVALVFSDGGQLFFNDMRIFGYMKLADAPVVAKVLQNFGPEPFSKAFTFFYFSLLFIKRSRALVKALLLNQELVAGLGNIYADEVCFCAGVRPMRRAGDVTKAEQKKLFDCIPKILKEALFHRGTTFRNFLDSSGRKGNYTDFLRVYDRDGEPCKKCGTIIKKTRVAGRGTHFCPTCQK